MPQKPIIEGNEESEENPPRRTGDNVPTSKVTPREAETMGGVPLIFLGIVIVIAIIVAVILLILK